MNDGRPDPLPSSPADLQRALTMFELNVLATAPVGAQLHRAMSEPGTAKKD